jgi:septum formation protein
MLSKKIEKYRIILASSSPRRQGFLREMNLDFEIQIKEVEEIYPDHLKGREITDYLALLKASAFNELQTNDILITSDTIVWHHGKALGKPKNATEAFEILQGLQNDTHEVITSVCFSTKKNKIVLHDVTRVTFSPLTNEEIHHYIHEYQPMDKAGAYGIQEWIGLVAISKIEGSYSNVVGLPTHLVYQYLKSLN